MRRVELPTLVATGCGVADEDLLTLHDALEQLRVLDERKTELVMLRFFAGLPMPEIAEILGVGLSTVEREWRFAGAWPQQRMRAMGP